ncbi:GNAT family N-acetyltransferase [Curtobacterium sp. MCPF17_002]|uniref:GNAT family N-acetyltransferase n=1 Tax=Curtobacterium sp. MCPF17_002 TaxID=2175645 RepID=UPI000DA7EA4C|nr:GNAT family N-acetyltransferase [Curtobacterium sp. MCPF17_002]WIB78379.1 GNAT family N-acetyltransferase [Curtobacterium sp. MCPF17_002]
MPDATTSDALTIDDLATAADADAFRILNEDWIGRFFTLEDEDRKLLGDPLGQIVEPGGAAFVARLGEDGPVIGCIGIAPVAPGVFELVKMAVSPDHQGHGTGRLLIATALDRARALGAHRVVLESNAQLRSAVHLYEAFGFRHLGHDEVAPSPYVRADVHMALDLVEH